MLTDCCGIFTLQYVVKLYSIYDYLQFSPQAVAYRNDQTTEHGKIC